MFYPLFCASGFVGDKIEILTIIIGLLLDTKRKTADKTLEQCFLKEFKAACETLGESSELKQRSAI